MSNTWNTPEQIEVKASYGPEDLKDATHVGTLPGEPPYVRGPYATMYVGRPWTIRQYAGFSTATESNAFYRRNLAAGQKALDSVAVEKPAYWRMVQGRPTYMVAYGPRTYGGSPGKVPT